MTFNFGLALLWGVRGTTPNHLWSNWSNFNMIWNFLPTHLPLCVWVCDLFQFLLSRYFQSWADLSQLGLTFWIWKKKNNGLWILYVSNQDSYSDVQIFKIMANWGNLSIRCLLTLLSVLQCKVGQVWPFLTARLCWRGLRNGLLFLKNFFEFQEKKWTFTALLADFSRK